MEEHTALKSGERGGQQAFDWPELKNLGTGLAVPVATSGKHNNHATNASGGKGLSTKATLGKKASLGKASSKSKLKTSQQIPVLDASSTPPAVSPLVASPPTDGAAQSFPSGRVGFSSPTDGTHVEMPLALGGSKAHHGTKRMSQSLEEAHARHGQYISKSGGTVSPIPSHKLANVRVMGPDGFQQLGVASSESMDLRKSQPSHPTANKTGPTAGGGANPSASSGGGSNATTRTRPKSGDSGTHERRQRTLLGAGPAAVKATGEAITSKRQVGGAHTNNPQPHVPGGGVSKVTLKPVNATRNMTVRNAGAAGGSTSTNNPLSTSGVDAEVQSARHHGELRASKWDFKQPTGGSQADVAVGVVTGAKVGGKHAPSAQTSRLASPITHQKKDGRRHTDASPVGGTSLHAQPPAAGRPAPSGVAQPPTEPVHSTSVRQLPPRQFPFPLPNGRNDGGVTGGLGVGAQRQRDAVSQRLLDQLEANVNRERRARNELRKARSTVVNTYREIVRQFQAVEQRREERGLPASSPMVGAGSSVASAKCGVVVHMLVSHIQAHMRAQQSQFLLKAAVACGSTTNLAMRASVSNRLPPSLNMDLLKRGETPPRSSQSARSIHSSMSNTYTVVSARHRDADSESPMQDRSYSVSDLTPAPDTQLDSSTIARLKELYFAYYDCESYPLPEEEIPDESGHHAHPHQHDSEERRRVGRADSVAAEVSMNKAEAGTGGARKRQPPSALRQTPLDHLNTSDTVSPLYEFTPVTMAAMQAAYSDINGDEDDELSPTKRRTPNPNTSNTLAAKKVGGKKHSRMPPRELYNVIAEENVLLPDPPSPSPGSHAAPSGKATAAYEDVVSDAASNGSSSPHHSGAAAGASGEAVIASMAQMVPILELGVVGTQMTIEEETDCVAADASARRGEIEEVILEDISGVVPPDMEEGGSPINNSMFNAQYVHREIHGSPMTGHRSSEDGSP